MYKFADRQAAGKVLAEQLKPFAKRKDIIVLALPRGGVPVGAEVAKALTVPLDVFVVRKLGVPGQEELAFGALAAGNVTVFNDEILKELHLSRQAINKVIQSEQKELKRREEAYRGKRPFPSLSGKIVILVDDGIATGASIRAAVKALRQLKPAHIILAVPVAEKTVCDNLALLVDRVVCPLKPGFFYAVGAWYDNFEQTTDEEVRDLLARSIKK